MQGSIKFAMIMSSRDAFYDLVHRVLKKDNDDTSREAGAKLKMISDMESSLENTDQMAARFFQGDDSPKLIEDLYIIIEEEDRRPLRIFPESRMNEAKK